MARHPELDAATGRAMELAVHYEQTLTALDKSGYRPPGRIAQQNLRNYVESLAADPFRRMDAGRALADLVRGHDPSRSVEAGMEATAQRWGMSVAELRELMDRYGVEACDA